jgi:hypothetical protein
MTSSPEKKWITYDGGTGLEFLTKYGITDEEARQLLYRARREAQYQAVKRARYLACDLAWSKKSILEKLMESWDRKVKNYPYLLKYEAEERNNTLWRRLLRFCRLDTSGKSAP